MYFAWRWGMLIFLALRLHILQPNSPSVSVVDFSKKSDSRESDFSTLQESNWALNTQYQHLGSGQATRVCCELTTYCIN